MSRKILGIAAGALVASFAAVAVFAGPAGTTPEVPTVADEHIGDSIPEEVTLLPEEGNPPLARRRAWSRARARAMCEASPPITCIRATTPAAAES